MKINPKITFKKAMAAAKAGMKYGESPGYCISCAAKAEGVEPDARKYKCDSCGEKAVYGAEELVIMLA